MVTSSEESYGLVRRLELRYSILNVAAELATSVLVLQGAGLHNIRLHGSVRQHASHRNAIAATCSIDEVMIDLRVDS